MIPTIQLLPYHMILSSLIQVSDMLMSLACSPCLQHLMLTVSLFKFTEQVNTAIPPDGTVLTFYMQG